MASFGLETRVVDAPARASTVQRFREAGILLPTFAQLADPSRIPAAVQRALPAVPPDEPHPLNLFRVHWYNDGRGGVGALPAHVELPPELTGVRAPILVAFGDTFPMIRAHKVLAAYGCLVPRLVTGRFDPARHRAVWPSTGNFCRGGVAISRILGCRGVAVLPEEMSAERFEWLAKWVSEPGDVVRTPGSESNVKEIYDRCRELQADPANVIFNQFCEFGNALAHRLCTGPALERVFEHTRAGRPVRLAAFVSASGSAGTLSAGDFLKERHGTRIVAAEALECPTMLENGFGAHNIQGIGDKHIPLIHNVMNTDLVVAVSDAATDSLDVLFNTTEGRAYLAEKNVPAPVLDALPRLGLSSICNVVAAIKTAKQLDLGAEDAIVTVATDSAAMYGSERAKTLRRRFADRFDARAAAEVFGLFLAGASTDHVRELTHQDRTRIFNLGYFTWVEQQGVSLADFERRRDPGFWNDLPRIVAEAWEPLIEEFNAESGVLRSLSAGRVPAA